MGPKAMCMWRTSCPCGTACREKGGVRDACLKNCMHDALCGDIKGSGRARSRIYPVNDLLPVLVLLKKIVHQIVEFPSIKQQTATQISMPKPWTKYVSQKLPGCAQECRRCRKGNPAGDKSLNGHFPVLQYTETLLFRSFWKLSAGEGA